MSALLRAELLRLASRRLLMALMVCMTALAAFSVMVSADTIRPMSALAMADIKDTVRIDAAAHQEYCDSVDEPECAADMPTLADYVSPPATFGEYAESVLYLGLPLLLVAVAAMVASLVGAEFTSGNIGTQLLFTPRRVPLMVGKLVAAGLAGAILTFTFLATAMALSAITFLSMRGAEDMSAGISLSLLVGRIVMLTLLLALMSGALTMGLGSAILTMILFTVVGVGSWVVGAAVSQLSWLQTVLPSNILRTMMEGEVALHEYVGKDYNIRVEQVIHFDWALAYTVVGVSLFIVLAGLWFRRRDIVG